MIMLFGRRQPLLRARHSLLSFLGTLLEPLVALVTLFAVTTFFGWPFSAPYVVLSLIVFSLLFPGASRINEPFGRVVREILVDWSVLGGLLLVVGHVSGYLAVFPRDVQIAWLIFTPIAQVAANEVARRLANAILSSPAHQRTAVIVGLNETGLRLARQVRNSPALGIRVLGFFDDRQQARVDDSIAHPHPLLGCLSELSAFSKLHRVELIYLALPMTTQPRILHLLDDLRDTTTSIYFVPDFFVTDLIQGRVDEVGSVPVVAVCETPFTGVNGVLKRASDIVLASCILLLIWPVMAAIAAGIKLGSPGPAIFRQRRHGLDGEEIIVYKFRTMYVCEDGHRIDQATRLDHRVTSFGAFLRRTSLDELPQFVNVLQGRMSVVGPRPHAIAHNEMYRKLIKGYMIRHKVKPGITGLAQVSGLRGETETLGKMKARIDCDLDYLRNWSLGLDLAIVLKTVFVLKNDKNTY